MAHLLLKGPMVWKSGAFEKHSDFLADIDLTRDITIDLSNCVVLPGLTDVHVHLREPGFSYKERIYTGTRAAARGGFTTVCAMPNLNPAPDSIEHLQVEQEIIERDAAVQVLPYGTITCGEKGEKLSEMAALAPYVAAFSDDGRGVQSEEMMRAAMLQAKAVNKLIVAHCEDNDLLHGGYIHDGTWCHEHGHLGISSESEWRQIARDVRLAKETGCGYHVCHISTKESVAIIRRAKQEGVNVTCETAPHYLLMDDRDMQQDANYKMNPPLRDQSDREALIEGLKDGTIDMIITDHAPHSAQEKSRGLKNSPMGIVGLETSFALMYTYLFKPGIISFAKLMELMHDAPNARFGITSDITKDYTVFEMNTQQVIDPEDFLSMGRNTPFGGWKVNAKCLLTVSNGKLAWADDVIKEILR